MSIRALSREFKALEESEVRYVEEAYKRATSRPYGYLLIDCTQTMSDKFRLRTNIWPDEEGPAIKLFMPK